MPLDLALSPERAFAAWPLDVPLGALWSGGPVGGWNRWTVLGRLSAASTRMFSSLAIGRGRGVPPDHPPFQGGWIGVIPYEHGGAIEPAAAPRAEAARGPAGIHWYSCDDALIYDRLLQRWWRLGDPPDLRPCEPAPYRVGAVLSTMTEAEYKAKAARVIEYIRAGDVYQVNLARFLHARFEGSPRAFFQSLSTAAEPWNGAYIEADSATICSASPEHFLSIDPTVRTVVTRPMKGTRRGHAHVAELARAPKDTAELNMITDLMRNDIGRICELGSVRVESARQIERHARADAALLQATATIRGQLVRSVTLSQLLAATFPGGSITGAPKIRAMQIISELEARPRGVYCGSIGFISVSGHAAFNIAIRTAAISQGIISYGIGAGIVADSDPASEWQETIDKAGVFLKSAGQLGARP
jgi:para-aminobenzoate synthetase component 1